MGLTVNQRQQIISTLVENCSCWQGPRDKELLNSFSDDKLASLHEDNEQTQKAMAIANVAIHGIRDGNKAIRVDPETGRWQGKIVGNNMGEECDDRGEYEPRRKKRPMPDDYEDDDYTGNSRRSRRRVTNRGSMTMEDLAKEAGPEFERTFRQMQQALEKEKDEVINQLLVNVAETDRMAHRERLQARDLDDLKYMQSLVPRREGGEEGATVVNRNGRPVRRKTGTDGGDMLLLPTINWKDDGSGGSNGNGKVIESDSGAGLDGLSEDEILEQLPASVRNRFQTALAIEERERRRLIDQITANIHDEDKGRRMERMLDKKPLSELRDIAALIPDERKRDNYFGAAVPLGRATTNASQDTNDDVLPPPKMDWNTDK